MEIDEKIKLNLEGGGKNPKNVSKLIGFLDELDISVGPCGKNKTDINLEFSVRDNTFCLRPERYSIVRYSGLEKLDKEKFEVSLEEATSFGELESYILIKRRSNKQALKLYASPLCKYSIPGGF